MQYEIYELKKKNSSAFNSLKSSSNSINSPSAPPLSQNTNHLNEINQQSNIVSITEENNRTNLNKSTEVIRKYCKCLNKCDGRCGCKKSNLKCNDTCHTKYNMNCCNK